MSYESQVTKFDNDDGQKINCHSAENSAFFHFISARNLVQRDQRSSSLPTNNIETHFRGRRRRENCRQMRSSLLMNMSDEDRRRRSTGSSLYRGWSDKLMNIFESFFMKAWMLSRALSSKPR